MPKKQFNLYMDEKLADAVREEARRLNFDGPSEFVRRQLLAYLSGDLDAVHRMLEHVLTRVDKPIDTGKLKLIKRLVDSFVTG